MVSITQILRKIRVFNVLIDIGSFGFPPDVSLVIRVLSKQFQKGYNERCCQQQSIESVQKTTVSRNAAT